MKKVVIGLSGGMDSATLLGHYIEQGYQVHCCSFFYGSKHNPYELKAAHDIISYYQESLQDDVIIHHGIDVRMLFKHVDSNLMSGGANIPEGHYEADNMKKTVVPGRNLIFASIMASIAESVGAEIIGLGVHSGDHHIYPDCRPAFIDDLSDTVYHSSDGKVKVEAPLQNMDKSEILKYGYSLPLNVPYPRTRTCYKAQPVACGKCGSCRERLEAFDKLKLRDPIDYEK
jgi:7-cyano-7-deazaguanine synthase